MSDRTKTTASGIEASFDDESISFEGGCFDSPEDADAFAAFVSSWAKSRRARDREYLAHALRKEGIDEVLAILQRIQTGEVIYPGGDDGLPN